jgi:lambda family phage tail tape measure protein
MGNEIQLGLRLTGNNREAVDVIRKTKDEVEQLSNSTGQVSEKIKAQNAAFAQTTAEMKKTAEANRTVSDESLKLDQAITKLRSSIDPTFASMQKLETANDLLHRGFQEGVIRSDDYQRMLDQVSKSFGDVTTSSEKGAFATATARRELIVMGHEVLTGEFSRIPGSFMVMAEHMGGITSLLNPMTIGIGAVGALVAAGAYAWSEWGDHANAATQRAIDGVKESKKELEDLQKEFDLLDQHTLKARIAGLQMHQDQLKDSRQKMLNSDGGLKGNLNIFNPKSAEEEFQKVNNDIANYDKQIGLANESLKNLTEGGGKAFKSFMENTGYMDKHQQKLHDLTKAEQEYTKAWLAASDDTQKADALARFNQAETNINKRYSKKSDSEAMQEQRAYATVSTEISKYASSLSQADEAGQNLTRGQQISLGVMERIANGTLKLSEVDKQRVSTQLTAMLQEEASINQKKRAIDVLNAFNEAQDRGIQNEIDAFNERYQAEEQANQRMAQSEATWMERLVNENEDLNAALITNDKDRARKQLENEHWRINLRIGAELAGSEKLQEALDQENANYDLRIKKLDETKNAAKELGMTFQSAFEDAIFSGKKFNDVLGSLLQDLAKMTLRKSVTEPLFNSFSSMTSGFNLSSLFSSAVANADGGVYAGPGISAFSGQIVSSPTIFPFAKGTGLMGEAGPEAILPLKRGSDGKLGVQVDGQNGSASVNQVYVTVDASGSQVQGNQQGSKELGNRIAAAVRDVLLKEKRPGGLLAA